MVKKATKFVLYNLAGEAKAYYRVDRQPLSQKQENSTGEAAIAHSIIAIDRSGSMYHDINPLKETLIKLLTLEEYTHSQLLITLISYSSQGNLISHFQRVPIQEVMKLNSSYLQEIQNIRVSGATCISQALQLATELIQPDELTAITLHSDGYANHPNVRSEVATLEQICQNLNQSNVFLNTIAYSRSSDFKLLSRLANLVSGTCVQAGSVKQVYDALYNTSKLLGEAVTEAIEEPLFKEYDYQIFLSRTAHKLNGNAGKLKILGLKPDDDGIFYKYQKLTQAEFEQLTDIPLAQTDESLFAFAKAQLIDGNLNQAKYALVSTFDATLSQRHGKAITNSQLVELSQDLDKAIYQPQSLAEHQILSAVPVNKNLPILELIQLFETHKDQIILNLKHLQDHYQRRGVKRVPGQRDADGNLVKPWLTTEYVDGGEYVQMGSFDINRNTATINLLITRPVKLVKVEDKTPITEVAGILLNELKSYNNYTLVGDGQLNVESLKVKFSNPKVFKVFKEQNLLSNADSFDGNTEYEIELTPLPIVPIASDYTQVQGIFSRLAVLRVLSSLFSAHLKEVSDTYSPDQVAALKEHYLSKSLYLNFPTTTEYSDLEEALNTGKVDSRVSYKIELGNCEILNLGQLHSANKFLDRFYEVYDRETGEKLDKPTFDQTLDRAVIFGHKTRSKRTKVTKVDDLMKPIFDEFLGLEKNGSMTDILNQLGASDLVGLLEKKWQDQAVETEQFVEALSGGLAKVNQALETLYRDNISPLVFHIGATGLIPDELDAVAYTADELAAKSGDLKFSKSEKEGMFFEVGDLILSVYPKTEYYSVS
ncbi:vWA domain-containing protein [Roseofilum capinflatum]|uniref:VWA domain-containing protein n=1 Tax=Roseofilum capinflatum BLCC-M114 TaxID=3022440 RepID=A0ABT7B818_9CYAN|nr:vWA domain-containing protein [Roseofilum capinflatum]MDJ1175250.1 VWA domain-containing protein [Roseofilum capinflatum BLCC-M114]